LVLRGLVGIGKGLERALVALVDPRMLHGLLERYAFGWIWVQEFTQQIFSAFYIDRLLHI
jgi:hypothetical protein